MTDFAESRSEIDAEWQEASGLSNGGDPGGVTPEMLRKFIRDVDCTMKIIDICIRNAADAPPISAALAVIKDFDERWPWQ